MLTTPGTVDLTHAEACAAADELADSSAYKIFVTAKAVICALGLLGLGIQWRRIGVRWLVHINTKALFSTYLCWTMLVALFFGLCYTIDAYRLWTSTGCPLMDYRLVFAARGIGVAALMAEIFIVLVLSFERQGDWECYSALRPLRFEKTKNGRIAFAAAAIPSILGVVLVFGLLMAPDIQWSAHVPTTNIKMPENAGRYQLLMWCMVVPEIVAIIVFHVDLWLNFYVYRRPDQDASISLIYQIQENKRIINILLPIEYLHFVCAVTASFGLALYPLVVTEYSTVSMQIFLEICTLPPYFPLLLTLILQYKFSWNPRIRKPTLLSNDDRGEEYFRSLKAQWGIVEENEVRVVKNPWKHNCLISFCKAGCCCH